MYGFKSTEKVRRSLQKVSYHTSQSVGHYQPRGASLVAQIVNNPPAMRETWDLILGWEGPWVSGYLLQVFWPWRIPWAEVQGSQRVRYDWAIDSLFSNLGENAALRWRKEYPPFFSC